MTAPKLTRLIGFPACGADQRSIPIAMENNSRIALGSDHGGFDLKERLKKWLTERSYSVEDCGTHDKSATDYPIIAAAVARLVSNGTCPRGILIDGAGIGSCMVANKFPGVRAALCYDVSSARNSREHNDANVLTLGAGLIGTALAEQIVELWLSTACTAERHLRRVAMIGDIESNVLQGREPLKTKSSLTHESKTEPSNRMTPEELRQVGGLADGSQADVQRIADRRDHRRTGRRAPVNSR